MHISFYSFLKDEDRLLNVFDNILYVFAWHPCETKLLEAACCATTVFLAGRVRGLCVASTPHNRLRQCHPFRSPRQSTHREFAPTYPRLLPPPEAQGSCQICSHVFVLEKRGAGDVSA